MPFEIEKGVPIPPKARSKRETEGKYPLRQMDVGDSFLIPLVETAPREEYAKVQQSVQSYASRWKIKVATRKVEGGIRVWRTE